MRSWRFTAAAAVVALAVQFYGLYRVAGPPTPPWFAQADKIEHVLGFALPVFLVLLALVLRERSAGRRGPRRMTVRSVLFGFGAQAALSELIQDRLYRSRTGDVLDVAADVTGIVLGWIGYRLAARALDPVPVRA